MKRSFSFSDINRLIDDYRKAEQRQREISEVGEYESEVRKAAVRYVDSEAMAMMEDIAVEELNRDKKGIRVKALRDHGYNNYADIRRPGIMICQPSAASVRTPHTRS